VLAPCLSTQLKLLDRSWPHVSMHSCIQYQLLEYYTKLSFHPVQQPCSITELRQHDSGCCQYCTAHVYATLPKLLPLPCGVPLHQPEVCLRRIQEQSCVEPPWLLPVPAQTADALVQGLAPAASQFCTQEEKRKEKCTLFSNHSGSPLRRQPRAMTIGTAMYRQS